MKQITEDYVSFEAAKLLKEKGLDEPSRFWYNDKGIISQKYIDPTSNPLGKVYSYAAPTQSLALKWLREVHKLHIKVGYDTQLKWYYDIISLKETVSFDYEEMKCYQNEFDFDSYEQAVEAAIKYTLKNLI